MFTKDGVFLRVVLLAVQSQQRAIVEVFDESFELVTEWTPRLKTQTKAV